MKKLILFILYFSLSIYSSFSQSYCATPSNVPDVLLNIPENNLNNPGPYMVRVFCHFIRTSAGTGGITTTEYNNAMFWLAYYLQPHNICISVRGTENINSDTYYNGDLVANSASVWSNNNQLDAIDIYFHPNSSPNPGGIADGIPGSALSIGGTWPGNVVVNTSSILRHEFGHCLGLYHTHHPFDFGGSCPDCNNGTNCTTCGDFVCDTPPDFGLSNTNQACNYTSGPLDACGALMAPDPSLFMSYSYPLCQSYYSNGQGQRMRDVIANLSIFQTYAVPNNKFVAMGPITGGYLQYAAINSVTAGINPLTSGYPFSVTASGKVELVARDYVFLGFDFLAEPNTSGYFYAHLDPFLCSVITPFNSARIASPMTYSAFLNNSKWLTTLQGFEGQLNNIYFQNGDTTINGLTYSKIARTALLLPGVYNDPSVLPGYTSPQTCLVREDINLRQVFLYTPNGEILLYDFSLSTGAVHPSNSSYSVITNDSVMTNTGYNNRLIFSNGTDSIIWVEGVGNIATPFENYVPFYANWLTQLICNYQNNTLVYDNGNLIPINCSTYLSLDDLNEGNAAISLTPNPSSGKFTIKLVQSNEKFISIKVYDVSGKLIYSDVSTDVVSSKQIDLSGFSKGVYTVSAMTSKQVYQNKIILMK